MPPSDHDTDLADVVAAFRDATTDLAKDFQDSFSEAFEDVQYRFDKELGRALAKHPELYAELKKTYRQTRKALEKVGKDLGL